MVEGLWDINALAEFLSVTPGTIRRWHRVAAGPPAIFVGRNRFLRWRPSDVEAWIEERMVAAAKGKAWLEERPVAAVKGKR